MKHYTRLTLVHGQKVKLYSRTGRANDVWVDSLDHYDDAVRARQARAERMLHPGVVSPFKHLATRYAG